MNPAPEEPPVNILWTGGWDSSYRVLHLVLVEKKTVAPLYFKSPWRNSTPFELTAIEAILAELAAADPAARARILPLRVFPMDDNQDPRDPFIADNQALQTIVPLGHQYAMIARELHRLDLTGVEMCIHVGDHPESGPIGKFVRLFRNRLEPVTTHGLTRHRLIGPADHDATARIFSRLLFPLHNVTKLQTRALARDHGFAPLLRHTWFCYHPRSGKPCGACVPCRQTIADGFGGRIGPTGHLRHLLRHQLPARWARIKATVANLRRPPKTS